MKFQIELGATVRDVITGFQGVVTGRAEFLTGCNQCVVVPPTDDKGAFREAHWFDETRLEVQSVPLVKLDEAKTKENPGCDMPMPSRS